MDSTIAIAGGTANLAIMAAIGHVCLQWSRLEMAVLGLLVAIELTEFEKGALLFGHLDLQPRVNMALNLARAKKLPPPVLGRITAVRQRLQKGGLADRRNQVVHGAHRDMEGVETTLTMIRWKGEKRSRRMTAAEINSIAVEAYELGSEVWSIMIEVQERILEQIRASEV
jgi:hypothetical protein